MYSSSQPEFPDWQDSQHAPSAGTGKEMGQCHGVILILDLLCHHVCRSKQGQCVRNKKKTILREKLQLFLLCCFLSLIYLLKLLFSSWRRTVYPSIYPSICLSVCQSLCHIIYPYKMKMGRGNSEELRNLQHILYLSHTWLLWTKNTSGKTGHRTF